MFPPSRWEHVYHYKFEKNEQTASFEEITASIDELTQLAEELNSSLEKFKV